MPAKKKILFITYGGSHVEVVFSLVPAIDAHPDLDYRILALTIAGNRLEPLGIPFKQCRDYLPLEGYEQAMELGTRLTDEIWDPSSTVPYEESCAYLGVSMTDLIASVGEKQAWNEYREKQRKAFLPVGFMEKVLDIEKPDIVVTTCHVRMEKAAHLAALKKGILSVRIEDLFGYSVLGEKPLDTSEPVLPKEEWPDRIIVPNESVRQRMMSAGIENWRVAALGQPFLSNWVEQSQSPKIKSLRKTFLSRGRPRITYIAPARNDVLYEQAPEVLKVAVARPDWDFLFKLHPSTLEKDFLALITNIPDNVSLQKKGNLVEIVTQSSVLIVFKSTIGYLGVLSRIPLVILDCTGEPGILPYAREGVATEVTDYTHLETALEKSIAHKVINVRHSSILEIHSGASQRIADYLAELSAN